MRLHKSGAVRRSFFAGETNGYEAPHLCLFSFRVSSSQLYHSSVGNSANRTRSAPTERLLPGRSENTFAHRCTPQPGLGCHILVSINGRNVSLCSLYGQKDCRCRSRGVETATRF